MRCCSNIRSLALDNSLQGEASLLVKSVIVLSIVGYGRRVPSSEIIGVFTMTETTRKQLVNKITNDFPKQKLFINLSEKRVNNRCLAPVLIRPPEAVAKFKQKQKQLVKQPDPKLTRLPPRHIICKGSAPGGA